MYSLFMHIRKKSVRLFLSAFICLLTMPSHAQQSEEGFYYIKSMTAANMYLINMGAGVGHRPIGSNPLKEAPKEFAQWKLIKVDCGEKEACYTIQSRILEKYLGAGQAADGRLYLYPNANYAITQWRVSPVDEKSFRIKDKVHSGPLASGERYDQKVYHHKADYTHEASKWIIEPAWEVKDFSELPDFYKQEIVVIDTVVHKDKITTEVPVPEKLHGKDYENNTSVAQKQTVEFEKKISRSEKITTSSTMTNMEMTTWKAGLTGTVGNDILWSGVISGSVERKSGTVKTSGKEKSITDELTITFKLKEPLTVPAYRKIYYESMLTSTIVNIPFTSKVKRTVKSLGLSEEATIDGVWEGVQNMHVSSKAIESELSADNGAALDN